MGRRAANAHERIHLAQRRKKGVQYTIKVHQRRRAGGTADKRLFPGEHPQKHSGTGPPHDVGPAYQRAVQRGRPHLFRAAARPPGPHRAWPDGAGDLHYHGLCQSVRHRRRAAELHGAGTRKPRGSGTGHGKRLYPAPDLRRGGHRPVSGHQAAHALPVRGQRRYLPLR